MKKEHHYFDLLIKKVDLLDNPKWTFIYIMGNKITAKIEDNSFLERFRNEHIKVCSGSRLPSKIRIEYFVDKKGIVLDGSAKYFVEKVTGNIKNPDEENILPSKAHSERLRFERAISLFKKIKNKKLIELKNKDFQMILQKNSYENLHTNNRRLNTLLVFLNWCGRQGYGISSKLLYGLRQREPGE